MRDKKADGLPAIFEEEESDDENTRLSDLLRFEPRAAEKPWLLVVSGAHSVGKLFEIRHKMTVGRAGADVVLEEEGVSKLHAQFEILAGGSVRVADLGSSNGMRVGGRLVKVHSLREGDRLRLGNAVLVLVRLDDLRDVVATNLKASSEALQHPR